MTQQQQTRASPDTGLSIAYRVMGDAVAFYLANGDAQKARDHIDRLASELKFYPDMYDAYMAALAKINEAERDERMKAEERSQQQLRDMMISMVGAVTSGMQQSALSPNGKKQTEDGERVTLPPSLATARAMRMWQRVQQAGYVDDDYQPLLSRTQAALLADAMATRLNIQNKWKTFEELWQRKNMRSDYNDAMKLVKSRDFIGKLKSLLSD